MFRVPTLPEIPMSREPMPADKQRSMRKTPWYATLPHRRGTPVTNTRKNTTAGSTWLQPHLIKSWLLSNHREVPPTGKYVCILNAFIVLGKTTEESEGPFFLSVLINKWTLSSPAVNTMLNKIDPKQLLVAALS